MSSKPFINPAVVAEHWQLEPKASVWLESGPGLSAAVFGMKGSNSLILPSPCDPATVVITVKLAPSRLRLEIDGSLVYDGAVESDTIQITRGGETPRLWISGDWRLVQFYLPVADLRFLGRDLGLSKTQASSFNIIDPRFRRDRTISRLGRTLDRRLASGDQPGRLELDEIALALGERLIRAHATVRPPRQKPDASPSTGEHHVVLEVLLDDDDSRLAEFMRLLGRPVTKAERAINEAFKAAPLDVRQSYRDGKPS